MTYEYSARRAKKDRAENDKQIERAQYYVDHPGQVVRRSILIAPLKNQGVQLNQALIEKHRLLEGIKGYKPSATVSVSGVHVTAPPFSSATPPPGPPLPPPSARP